MAEPSDDDKKTAAALLPVCAHDHHGHPCGACLDVRTQIAAALAESREEGRREERRACWEAAARTPVAWAVLCAGGMPHKANRHTLLFAGAAPDAWSNGLCIQADRESACGPHRIVPLFAGELIRG